MNASPCPAIPIPEINGLGGFRAVFLLRHPTIPVNVDRTEALARLAPIHETTRLALGFSHPLALAEQVHGAEVALVDQTTSFPVPGADGLATNQTGLCLGIYVADCAAVYLVDPVRKAAALIHSGKKGTEAGIVPTALRLMTGKFGSRPEEITAWISPCIRPPHYEVDIASEIIHQAQSAGVTRVIDSGICTFTHADTCYSYRREKGFTGRMLALLEIL